MRFGIRSGLFAAAALALVWGVPAGAADIKLPGKIGMVKPGFFKVVAKPVGAFTLPVGLSSEDPTVGTSSVHIFDSDGSGVLDDPLTGGPSGGWDALGSDPMAPTGYKYKNVDAPTGGAVKILIFKPAVIKMLAKSSGTMTVPLGGNLGIELVTDTNKRCFDFGGTEIKETTALWKHKDAPPPSPTCLVASPPCCNGDSFLNFSTITAPGDCGDILDATGMLVANINCSGLYTGGGGNSVPLPYAIPDLGSAITAIASCAADVATVGGTSSTTTGSNKNCSNPGCRFGAPLTVPNPISTPTSACVVNEIATAPTGTVNCGTGATSINLPLTSEIFLTGDKDAGTGGIQPCPRCIAGSCAGGANDMDPCIAGTTSINVGYPTSNDCAPDGSDSIGTIPIAFILSSGTVAWSGTGATNDTGSTASTDTRTFAGYCRDKALPGGTGSFDASGSAGNQFRQCWENGMAVGAPCSEADNGAESCEQRTQGAFGPNGGANRTIRAIGSAASILGGPAAAKLVSVFSIPPTFDATIDGAGDLPGPGAVAIPGTAASCSNAMSCP